MVRLKVSLVGLVLAIVFSVPSFAALYTIPTASGKNVYVNASSGNDYSTCGSSGSPCKTIGYVDRYVVAPGDVVHVTGTFNLTSGSCIVTDTSGTSTKPITYVADPIGSARINGQGACKYMWYSTASYQRVYGFDFTGIKVQSDLLSLAYLSEASQGNVVVAYNTFHDFPYGFEAAVGIMPWGNGGYTGAPCSVHDNVFRNLGLNSGKTYNNYGMYVTCGKDTWIYNNLLVNIGTIGIHTWHHANGNHIHNNTIVNNQYIGILAGTGDGGYVQGAYFEIANNIVVGSKYAIRFEHQSPGSISSSSLARNNLVYNNSYDFYFNDNGNATTLSAKGISVTGTIKANPLFVSSSDFRLQSSSPAINKGSSTNAPTRDLAGNSRPSGGAFEIGAYEYGATSSTPAPSTPTNTTTSSTVRSLVAQHSGKCLDVAGKSTSNGASVLQWACTGGTNQKFEFVSKGNGQYQIKAQNSGKCLDVEAASTTNGARIQQWNCTTGTNQLFTLKDMGSGYVSLVSVKSGKCVDINGVSKSDGAKAQQWTCTGGANQKFLRK